MAKRTSRTSSSRLTPNRQLAGFVVKFEPAIQRLVRAARARLRKRMPTANELVYDNYNALAIGFGPSERTSEAFLSLAVYPRWVSLYFLQGIRLPDPKKLLKGSGNLGRYVVLQNASDLELPAIRALLEAAIRSARAAAGGAARTHAHQVDLRQATSASAERCSSGAQAFAAVRGVTKASQSSVVSGPGSERIPGRASLDIARRLP